METQTMTDGKTSNKIKRFAIKSNRIMGEIIVSPLRTKEDLDRACNDFGYDGWVEIDTEALSIISGFKDSREVQDDS